MTATAGDRHRRAAAAQRAEDLLANGAPNPRRITIALDMASLYGPEVDAACGGAEPMVDEWEAGARRPTAQQMRLLADLTGYPVEFFYQPDPPPMTGFICRRSGPGKGCTPIDDRPAAAVAALHPDTLF